MKRQIGYKFRIYPTIEQMTFFAKHFGCTRFIYNHLLVYMTEFYEQNKKSVSVFEAKKLISKLKRTSGYEWLKEVNSQSLQEAALGLGKAFQRFFSKLGGYPVFKRKFGKQTFKVPQNFVLKVSKKGNWFLCIPKLGSVIKIKVHRKIIGTIKQVTISRDPDGRYYASLNCEIPENYVFDSKDDHGKRVGLDLGLTTFVATSDGEKIDKPKYTKTAERKLAKEQKKLSKKKKGSSNYKKAAKKVAFVYSTTKNQRNDFIHKVSSRMVSENQVIYIEDLNVRGMIRNRHLSKAIADASWSKFTGQLSYKAVWRKKEVIKIGRFEASSKLCSNCWHKNETLKLADREWQCEFCGVLHDRDINAAIVILIIGQGMPKLKPAERTTSVFSMKKRQVGSKKQEPDSECYSGCT